MLSTLKKIYQPIAEFFSEITKLSPHVKWQPLANLSKNQKLFPTSLLDSMQIMIQHWTY